MEGKTIIEVNGVKLEVDLRTAKRIDELRVGDRVKVLTKGYSEYEVKPGTIVGFEPFQNLPTMIVAVLDVQYNKATIKFVYFNAQSKEVEIIKAIDDDQLEINKAEIMAQFEREIQQKRLEIEDIERRRNYFVATFKAYWPDLDSVGV